MPIIEAHRRVQVTNDTGLHLRLASRFMVLASRFRCEVRVSHGEKIADARSILEMLSLAASHGAWLDLEARGSDAQEALGALADMVESWSREEEKGRPVKNAGTSKVTKVRAGRGQAPVKGQSRPSPGRARLPE